MNPEQFILMMNDLPDAVIVSANSPAVKQKHIIRYLIPAAAACLVIGLAAAVYPKLRMHTPDVTEPPADSEVPAEPELPIHYIGGGTMDRRMPASYSDLVNNSDAIVIAEAVAEKEQIDKQTYNVYMKKIVADDGLTLVSYKVNQVLAGDIQEGDTLDIREYHYTSLYYNDDGTITDCIISRSNAKPAVIGETYLLFLTKWPDKETWDFTFDEYGIYTYDGEKAGPWLREDMDQESYDYQLYQYISREVAARLPGSDEADH